MAALSSAPDLLGPWHHGREEVVRKALEQTFRTTVMAARVSVPGDDGQPAPAAQLQWVLRHWEVRRNLHLKSCALLLRSLLMRAADEGAAEESI